jgi:hypothetical protein
VVWLIYHTCNAESKDVIGGVYTIYHTRAGRCSNWQARRSITGLPFATYSLII